MAGSAAFFSGHPPTDSADPQSLVRLAGIGYWVFKYAKASGSRATYYTGVMGLYRTTGDREVLEQAVRWAEKHKWAEGDERERANKKTCGQTCLELYFIEPDPPRIARIRAYVDSRIEKVRAGESPTKGW